VIKNVFLCYIAGVPKLGLTNKITQKYLMKHTYPNVWQFLLYKNKKNAAK